MKDLKKLIIAMIAIVIVIIIIVIILMENIKKQEKIDIQEKTETQEETANFDDDTIDYTKVEVENTTSSLDYYSIINCIQTYFDTINKNNSIYFGYADDDNDGGMIDETIAKQKMYDLLSDKYMQNNNITLDNIYDYIHNIEEQVMFTAVEMRELKGEKSNSYAVYGFIQDTEYNYIEDIYLIVYQDEINTTFSIEVLDSNNYDSIEDITLSKENFSITPNENNKYNTPKVDEAYIATDYFNTCKKMILGKPELSYSYLNEEYRDKRFKNYDNYKKYIEENREKIKKLGITKYQLNDVEEYIEYICLDQENNYYIFREKDNMKFEVFLDTYTIDSKQFLDKYNSSSEKVKEGMNVEKFFESINHYDYEYAYSVLADSFKENNYPSEEQFENEIKNNLFEHNYVEYKGYEEQEDLGVFTITVSNTNNDEEENKQQKTMTVIVQLQEGTDFVMSFSIE